MTSRLWDHLDKRREAGLLRQLPVQSDGIDLLSNDYLGLARSTSLQSRVALVYHEARGSSGATGSRLLSGNSHQAEALESELAEFLRSEATLMFNSGYDANLGLFSSIGVKGNTVILDELAHASMIDGNRLGHAKRLRFRHNDLDDLDQKLQAAEGAVFVGVESVYSMDGDFAPLEALAKRSRKHGFHLIVDEAHAFGLFGAEGRGLVDQAGISEHVWARIITFGKALGAHGAAIVGSKDLRDYLINYARSFIYSTALPLHSLVSIECALTTMRNMNEERRQLHQLIDLFRRKISESGKGDWLDSGSCIQSLIVPGNQEVTAVCERLRESGFQLLPVRYPTVPEGKERLRCCLHLHNTEEEINLLFEHLDQVL